MPFKYIGRTHDFKGKTLWEILGNLRNFGVGRIVARSRFERYPEPCYMKILKVETLPNPEEVTVDNLRKVRVWVERVFRGVRSPKPIVMESTTYKTDYRLIPKDLEEEYCKFAEIKNEHVIKLPKTTDFPPLMRELLVRDLIAKGEELAEEPKLELAFSRKSKKIKYQIVEDGVKPDVEITVGLGTPASPSLYEGIKL